MTGEPAHITSKERMVPELMFLSERAPQLSVESEVAITLRYQLCSAHYTVLQTKNSRRSTSAINPATTKNTDDSHKPQLSITDSKVKAFMLHFHHVTERYKLRHLCNQSSHHTKHR